VGLDKLIILFAWYGDLYLFSKFIWTIYFSLPLQEMGEKLDWAQWRLVLHSCPIGCHALILCFISRVITESRCPQEQIKSGTKISFRKPSAVRVYHTRCLALQSLEKWQADTFMSTITRWSWHQWHVLCRSSDPQLFISPFTFLHESRPKPFHPSICSS